MRPVREVKIIKCSTCKGTGLVNLWNNTKGVCRDCKGVGKPR